MSWTALKYEIEREFDDGEFMRALSTDELYEAHRVGLISFITFDYSSAKSFGVRGRAAAKNEAARRARIADGMRRHKRAPFTGSRKSWKNAEAVLKTKTEARRRVRKARARAQELTHITAAHREAGDVLPADVCAELDRAMTELALAERRLREVSR